MEQLNNFIPAAVANAKAFTVAKTTETQEIKIVVEGERAYASKYTNDAPASPEQIKQVLSLLFAVFHHTPDEQIAITSAVVRNKMTLLRLRDAVNHLIDTFNFGSLRPLPADIIKFDAPDQNARVFRPEEVYNICKCMVHRYYDMDISDNVYAEEKHYNRCRDAFFVKLSPNSSYWRFTEKGNERSSELLFYLNQSINLVEFIGTAKKSQN